MSEGPTEPNQTKLIPEPSQAIPNPNPTHAQPNPTLPRLKTIEGAGHWVHVTNPKDLQDSVGTLIKGMDSWRGRGSFAKRFVERIRSRKIK